MVPENIHTPTTEAIGNSKGVGDQRPRKLQRDRGLDGQFSGLFKMFSWRRLYETWRQFGFCRHALKCS